jgi:predicted DNA-binding transcriptional regulator YafY
MNMDDVKLLAEPEQTPEQTQLKNLAEFVAEHQIITFTYKDKVRLVEPHTLGNDGKLSAYQLFPEEGWRLFLLKDMVQPTFQEPRPGYKRGDQRLKEGILAEV